MKEILTGSRMVHHHHHLAVKADLLTLSFKSNGPMYSVVEDFWDKYAMDLNEIQQFETGYEPDVGTVRRNILSKIPKGIRDIWPMLTSCLPKTTATSYHTL